MLYCEAVRNNMAIEYSLIDRSQKNSQKSNTKNSRTAEVNGKTLSISFRIDEGVIEHNNRIFIAKNVDGERVQDNITFCRQDIREAYIRPHSRLRENS